ncbi:MAG: ACT domain-containing protein [Clostridia bacterium]|jgi:chorismate mutase|nr:ACT domain-containing protein [Clostridia bacterium]
MSDRLYLVSAAVLPEAVLKTAQAKELLARGEVRTVNEAVERTGISRSTFYKYRDGIFAYPHYSEQQMVTLSLLLNHQAGVLLRVINSVTELGGNIVTINQNIPVQGIANVSITIEIAGLSKSPVELIDHLAKIDGVTRVDIIS